MDYIIIVSITSFISIFIYKKWWFAKMKREEDLYNEEMKRWEQECHDAERNNE